jgi:hypothetical protein
LRVFWGKKIGSAYIERNQNFERYIVKIEISVTELKIALNFRVIHTFPFFLFIFYFRQINMQNFYQKQEYNMESMTEKQAADKSYRGIRDTDTASDLAAKGTISICARNHTINARVQLLCGWCKKEDFSAFHS